MAAPPSTAMAEALASTRPPSIRAPRARIKWGNEVPSTSAPVRKPSACPSPAWNQLAAARMPTG
ncbi:Uncharacterised protein [Bordetella pertussis]|nr:Uncharacterised protein [Bordetella pertussis]CFM63868.1 Uncharacterised protein [Bordetella pertussis]CFM92904.1 Uncharacterised protein [Bordetella pertussis]CFN08076.1 Uncharacterised protein [Bordetella pertussis]CFN60955.1 Uncharacterised protein [Bordetella pertussis]